MSGEGSECRSGRGDGISSADGRYYLIKIIFYKTRYSTLWRPEALASIFPGILERVVLALGAVMVLVQQRSSTYHLLV